VIGHLGLLAKQSTAAQIRFRSAQIPNLCSTRQSAAERAAAGIVPNTNGAVTSAVLVHLRVEPAHFDWRWRERPALALLAWEALARDPVARLRRIQVESIGTTINFRSAAITNRDIAASALLIASRLALTAALDAYPGLPDSEQIEIKFYGFSCLSFLSTFRLYRKPLRNCLSRSARSLAYFPVLLLYVNHLI
jgi:hypothetical protein